MQQQTKRASGTSDALSSRLVIALRWNSRFCLEPRHILRRHVFGLSALFSDPAGDQWSELDRLQDMRLPLPVERENYAVAARGSGKGRPGKTLRRIPALQCEEVSRDVPLDRICAGRKALTIDCEAEGDVERG